MCLNCLMLCAVPRNASKLGQIVFTPLRIWCCRHLQDHVGNLLPREVYAGHLGRSQQPWWNLMEGLMFMAYTRWVHESLVCSIHPLRGYTAWSTCLLVKSRHSYKHHTTDCRSGEQLGWEMLAGSQCVYRLFINSMYVQPGCPSEVTAPPPHPAWSMLPRWRSPTRTGRAGWFSETTAQPSPMAPSQVEQGRTPWT